MTNGQVHGAFRTAARPLLKAAMCRHTISVNQYLGNKNQARKAFQKNKRVPTKASRRLVDQHLPSLNNRILTQVLMRGLAMLD